MNNPDQAEIKRKKRVTELQNVLMYSQIQHYNQRTDVNESEVYKYFTEILSYCIEQCDDVITGQNSLRDTFQCNKPGLIFCSTDINSTEKIPKIYHQKMILEFVRIILTIRKMSQKTPVEIAQVLNVRYLRYLLTYFMDSSAKVIDKEAILIAKLIEVMNVTDEEIKFLTAIYTSLRSKDVEK